MQVVVAEKPSVARDLARVLGVSGRGRGVIRGKGLAITWCRGHMAALAEPAHYNPDWKRWSLEALPMLPEAFALTLRGDAGDQFSVLQELLCDPRTEGVVNACDAGREGELIFRYVYDLAGCTASVQRLWISSLTDEAIREGWSRLRPGADFDRLADAARCRSEADWLVGLNATRALTCRGRDVGGSGLLSVGRVQTPTLAMIVSRDREIAAFVPEDFWQVKAKIAQAEVEDGEEALTFESTYFQPKVKDPEASNADRDGRPKEVSHAERLPSEEIAQAILDATQDAVGQVERAERKRKVERPPLLYDLTSLQRRANQRFGLSAQRTLEVAQALYEKHKLITYPRTDARYLTPDQVPLLPDVVRGLLPIPPYAPFAQELLASPIDPGSRVINAKEVGDHHAIIPTGDTPGSHLSGDEKRVFDLVARRLLAALSADALFDVTRLVVAFPPQGPLPDGIEAPLRYRARGRVCRQEGWRAVDPPGRSRDVDLPAVEVDDDVTATAVEVAKGQTRPPRHHNDATLLRAMETAGKVLDDDTLMRALRGKGLGTPATRASIIQTLLDRSYIEREGRDMRATDKGQSLIDAVPVDALKNAELTGDWEGRLSELADGRGPGRGAFMEAVETYTTEIVSAIRAADPPKVDPEEAGPSLGDCPVCDRPVRDRHRVWRCDSGRSCAFVVFRQMSNRDISPRMVKQLLADGKSKAVKGFRSKAGKDFSAGLIWDPDRSRVGFWFPPSTAKETPARKASTPRSPPPPLPPGGPRQAREGQACPTCGEGTVIRGRRALGCSRWREGCGFRTDAVVSSSGGTA